jgi:hypothetical protein
MVLNKTYTQTDFPMNSFVSKIQVLFDSEPYTFIDVAKHRQIWKAPNRKSSVVYLWCIEYEGDYLVNYVGKTWDKRGFHIRQRDQLRYWRDGHCDRVDLEAFKKGKRIVVPTLDHDQLDNEVRELEPLYCVFITRLDKEYCISVENEIVYRLQKYEATKQFLCNKNNYSHDPKVEIQANCNPRIIGLTAPIPPSYLKLNNNI